MSNVSNETRSLGDEFIRVVGMVVLALLAGWLALKVLSGVIRFIAGLVTLALFVGVILVVLYFAFSHRGRSD